MQTQSKRFLCILLSHFSWGAAGLLWAFVARLEGDEEMDRCGTRLFRWHAYLFIAMLLAMLLVLGTAFALLQCVRHQR